MIIVNFKFMIKSSILLAFIIALTFSCDEQPKLVQKGVLPTGSVDLDENPLSTDGGLFYNFKTSSELVSETQGGTIKINEPDEVNGTMIMYYWSLGNGYYSNDSSSNNLINKSIDAGYRVIQVKWDTSWLIGSQKKEGFKNMAVHPATITKEIINRFSATNKPVVLYGGSGGAAQIAYMLSFYGIDNYVDAAIIWAGFWMGRLDIGCLDKNPLNEHLHYSEQAKSFIDLSYGYDFESIGPCQSGDTTYRQSFLENSISFGGDYHFPNTEIYLFYAGNDEFGALNQGLTYYEQLISNGSPKVHMQIVEGSPHSLSMDRNGYALLRKTVLRLINESPTKR